jgi:hypothetical protein
MGWQEVSSLRRHAWATKVLSQGQLHPPLSAFIALCVPQAIILEASYFVPKGPWLLL